MVVDESALGEIDEPVAMEIGVPIVQECEVRHVKSPADRDYIIQSISLTPFVPSTSWGITTTKQAGLPKTYTLLIHVVQRSTHRYGMHGLLAFLSSSLRSLKFSPGLASCCRSSILRDVTLSHLAKLFLSRVMAG